MEASGRPARDAHRAVREQVRQAGLRACARGPLGASCIAFPRFQGAVAVDAVSYRLPLRGQRRNGANIRASPASRAPDEGRTLGRHGGLCQRGHDSASPKSGPPLHHPTDLAASDRVLRRGSRMTSCSNGLAEATRVALVVFLRGVNVGGHRTFRPTELAVALKHLGAIDIGAAGTLVIRQPMTQAQARAEVACILPFVTQIVVCQGREILQLLSNNPFPGWFSTNVSILLYRPSHSLRGESCMSLAKGQVNQTASHGRTQRPLSRPRQPRTVAQRPPIRPGFSSSPHSRTSASPCSKRRPVAPR